MQNSENTFKKVSAKTQYLPVSFKSKKSHKFITTVKHSVQKELFYYFYLGTQNMPLIFCLKSLLKTQFQ